MSNAAINNIDSLHEFRNKLTSTVEDLKEQLKKTECAIEDVAKSWKDSQFIKFKEGFDEDKDTIIPLCDNIDKFNDGPLYDLEQILIEYRDLM